MDTPGTIGTIIVTTVTIMGLWTFYVWIWPDYLVDRFRQDLFTIRDDLFDLAASGELSFDHPAYHIHRNLINGCIRFAHQLSVIGIVTPMLFFRRELAVVESLNARRKSATSGLPSSTEAKLDEIHAQVSKRLIMHFVYRSPFLSFGAALLVLVIAIPLLLIGMYKRLLVILTKEKEIVMGVAETAGRDDLFALSLGATVRKVRI